jgi:hypothetical protein
VRAALGSLLLSLGLFAASLALSGWWLERTVFDPSRSDDIAVAALGNDSLRSDLADTIADQVAGRLHTDPATVRAATNAALARPGIASAFAGVTSDVHARLIGAASGPVVVSPQLLATAVGDPRAAALPPVQFDVPTVAPLDAVRRWLAGVVPILAIAGAGLALIGLIVHSRTATAVRIIGWWCLGASIVQVVVAYVLPVLVLPNVISNPYVDLVGEVARAAMAPLIGVLIMLAGAGIGCLVAGAWLDNGRPVRVSPVYAPHPYGW